MIMSNVKRHRQMQTINMVICYDLFLNIFQLATKLKRFGSHTDSTHTAFENTVDSVDNDIQRESKENNNIQPVISDEDSQEKSDVQLDKDRGSKEIVATPDGVVTVSLWPVMDFRKFIILKAFVVWHYGDKYK